MGIQVMTKKGLVEGVDKGSHIIFKGIPYAKPPVGELRWKAPEDLPAWDGVFRADKFGNITIQDLPDPKHPFMGRFAKEFYSNPEFIPEMSEDCLYLNIWIPKDTEGKKLPVAFWIHGGGFAGGYSCELEFDGEAYCRKNVILVSAEYRCNVFGFLAHSWLDKENEKGISGNYGILDQIAALKWVHENIENFGGDPENITVFGQSAGSMSTQILVSSNLTEGLIAKAIMQSGVSCEEEILATPTLKEEEEIGEMFVKIAEVKNIDELRALTSKQLMDAKRALDAELWKLGKGLLVVPNRDGYVLNQTVKEVWKAGTMKNIPYMLGVVTDDLGARKKEVEEKRTGMLMEECKKWSLQCEKVMEKGSYVYFFSHDLPGDDWGAFHSAELWYTFGTISRCWRPMSEEDYKLSEEMVACWTNFMKTGNPNGEGTQDWKPYTKTNAFIREFK